MAGLDIIAALAMLHSTLICDMDIRALVLVEYMAVVFSVIAAFNAPFSAFYAPFVYLYTCTPHVHVPPHPTCILHALA